MVSIPSESCNIKGLERRPSSEDPITDEKSAQNFVTCIHRAKLAEKFRNIDITWAKNLIGHSLHITVENPLDENSQYTCKIDLKTWQFWGKKGLKSLKVEENRVDIFWDLKSAKFSNSPEPKSDYYVAIVSEKEVILLLGDQMKEALRRTKCRLRSEGKREHDIIIESALSGPYDPEMWISIDGIESIRITNLHWRFRGNDTIVVDDVNVEIFWDVHDWLYNGLGSGGGMFIFRQGGEEEETSYWEFCHFLYAWKLENEEAKVDGSKS
ncbi:hypothetical protein F511_11612 [Dorcoceras hygrometricum]|uniref:DUF868 domain-containing protein n=1 Tax=Dorcoceras hygrometricum TaxID=472368 RepID=A0A2Z7AZY1_9LAMI|nr:hypothetical protein F511_11612 [Dorcoceras hygrometricum]